MIPRGLAGALLFCWLLFFLLVHAGLLFGAQGLAGAPEGSGLELQRLLRFGANSLYVSILAAAVATACGIVPALVCARLERGTSRAFMLAILAAPLLISPAVYSVVAVHLFGAQGYITDLVYTKWQLLQPVAAASSDPALRSAPIFTLTGTAFTIAWAYLPVASLVLFAGFQRTDRSQEEAALLETTFTKYAARLLIPSAFPFLLLSFLLMFLLGSTEFSIPESLRSQPVLVQEIYTQFGIYYDARTASLAALAVVGIASLALGSIWFLLRRIEGDPLQDSAPAEEQPAPKSGTRVLRWVGWILAVLPFATLLAVLFVTLFGPAGPLALLRLTWAAAREELFFTMQLAAVAAAGSCLLGLVQGMLLAGSRRPWLWRFLLLVAFLVPGPVTAIAFKNLVLQPPGMIPEFLDDLLLRADNSPLPLLLAWILRFSPLTALLVEMQLRRLPREQFEAWRLESRNPLSAVRTWLLQAVTPALGAGTLIVFALVAGEGGAALILIPPGTTTLSVRILTLMHYAPAGQVSALCLLMSLPALAMFPIIAFTANRIRLARSQPRETFPR